MRLGYLATPRDDGPCCREGRPRQPCRSPFRSEPHPDRPQASGGVLGQPVYGSQQLHALVGGEGMGKTWAILDWWNSTAGDDGSEQPLTIWLKAADLRGGSIDEAMADALRVGTDIRDSAFWARRLRRWLSGEGRRILVLLDGLNQNFLFRDWAHALQGIFAPPWRDKVSVVVTCRPDSWDDLKGLRDLTPEPVEIEVGRFTDVELDELLEPYGIDRASVAAPLLDLLRVPRLFALAVRNSDRLAGADGLTPERLVLADWSDRVGRHGNRAGLDEDEFRALASRLGLRLVKAIAAGEASDTLSRRELLEELGRDRGPHPDLQAAVSELVDGRWLPRKARHDVALDVAVAPIALGLSLLDVVQGKTDAALDDAMADFLDPLRGADLEAGVLRAAATAAIIERTTMVVRKGLLSRWLMSQNFARRDFAALWPLIGFDPTVFLDVAEDGWRSGRFEQLRDDFMAKAFANACRWPSVVEALDARFRSWLATAWPGGGPRSRDWVESPGGHTASISLLVSHFRMALDPAVPGASLLHMATDASGGFLIKHSFAICSFCSLAGIADALVAWALAGAAMGGWPHAALAAWVLRNNRADPEETERAILKACRAIAAAQVAEALPAVGILLAAQATPAAMRLADELCVIPVPFPDTMARAEAGWPARALVTLAGSLGEDDLKLAGVMSTSRAATLTDGQIASLVTVCRRLSPEDMVSRIKSARCLGPLPALARWANDELGQLFERIAQASLAGSGIGCPEWLKPIREEGSFLAAFMEPPSRTVLATAFLKRPLPFTPGWKPGLDGVALGLYGLSPDRQLDWLATVAPIRLPEASHCVLDPLLEASVEQELSRNAAGLDDADAESSNLR